MSLAMGIRLCLRFSLSRHVDYQRIKRRTRPWGRKENRSDAEKISADCTRNCPITLLNLQPDPWAFFSANWMERELALSIGSESSIAHRLTARERRKKAAAHNRASQLTWGEEIFMLIFLKAFLSFMCRKEFVEKWKKERRKSDYEKKASESNHCRWMCKSWARARSFQHFRLNPDLLSAFPAAKAACTLGRRSESDTPERVGAMLQ